MSNPISIRKFPVGISDHSRISKGGEFVIPDPSAKPGSSFIGLKSGKPWPYGAVSMIGRSITASDVLDRASDKVQTLIKTSDTASRITDYLDQLQQFKVGNVLTVEYDAQGGFVLKLVRTRPGIQGPKLPK